jgi:protein TonB
VLWEPFGTGVAPQQVDQFPEATNQVPPEYPPAARDAGLQGIVLVGVHVSRTGLVDSVRVIRSIPGLDSAAVAAVSQWRFKPARYRGNPVAVWTSIPVRFTLH